MPDKNEDIEREIKSLQDKYDSTPDGDGGVRQSLISKRIGELQKQLAKIKEQDGIKI